MDRHYRRRIGWVVAIILLFSPNVSQSQEMTIPYSRGGAAGVPNYYMVQYGDTLFDIAEAFFGSPWEWPRVWSYNPQITNPHWIYPGDIVFLRPPADPGQQRAFQPPGEPGTHYPLCGFYTGSELENVGTIRFSPTPYGALSLFDTVYLEFEDPGSVSVGDRFALNNVMERIYDDDDELIAVKYRVTGVVEALGFPDTTPLVIGRIIQAWDMIERGDVLFVNQRHIRVVEPREASISVEGEIIDFFEPTHYSAETWYVFIDVGYNDGVREGNRFTVWDRYDEYAELIDGEPGWDEDDEHELLPWRRMGEAIVIFTSNEYSTAVLTYSDLELERGMRVTLTDGY